MRKLDQKFTIHPIGQGLFYSGEINHNGRVRFRMIFDCGCLPKRSGADEIEEYRKEVFEKGEKYLDLLVISHFDADHINHIKTLLRDDVRVRKVVMPFATFAERLFLVARYIVQYGNEDDGTINFMIDPAGALGPNLGDDGELYLIDSDPNSSIPPDEDQPDNDNVSESSDDRFLFDFSPQAKEGNNLTIAESNEFGGSFNLSNSYKIKDTNKGMLLKEHRIKIMDFLFYKKDIGAAQTTFFKIVEQLFFTQCGIIEGDKIDTIVEKIVSQVSKMKNAQVVKNIFKTAMKDINKRELSINKTELVNLNTTALCMMHINLKSFLKLVDFMNWNNGYWRDSNPKIINKIGGLKILRTDALYDLPYHNEQYYRDKYFAYPNVLLTSDSYLKKENDVDALWRKYKNYLDKFWLFQMPHHGSEKNADKILLSHLPFPKWNFINYGINNIFGHPSAQLVSDIVATGHFKNLVPVNEFQGMSFGINIYG